MRTKGAVSFQRVKLSDLNLLLKEDCEVVVSTKWAQNLGFTIEKRIPKGKIEQNDFCLVKKEKKESGIVENF